MYSLGKCDLSILHVPAALPGTKQLTHWCAVQTVSGQMHM